MKANYDERWRWIVAMATMLVCALVALPSFAAPTPAQKETARNLMDAADGYVRDGNHEKALKAFKAADDIMHHPTTGIEVARILRVMGRLIEAKQMAIDVFHIAVKKDEQKVTSDARQAAIKMKDELGEEIPLINLKITGLAEGVAPIVSIDGVARDSSALLLPLPVDPGKHTVKVSAVGYKTVSKEVELKKSEKKDLSVSLVIDPDYIAAPPKPETVPKPQPPPKGGDKVEEGGISPLVYAGFSVAGAGLVVGAITGGLSMAKSSEIGNTFNCQDGGECNAQGPNGEALDDEVSSATALANVSNVAFAVAGAGAVLGTIGFFMPTKAEVGDVSLRPTIGFGKIGITGTF